MYKVISKFADLQDGKHLYQAGDEYPRNGVKVSEKRIDELKGKNNLAKKPLIEEVADKKVEKAVVEEEPKKPASKKGKKTDDADNSL